MKIEELKNLCDKEGIEWHWIDGELLLMPSITKIDKLSNYLSLCYPDMMDEDGAIQILWRGWYFVINAKYLVYYQDPTKEQMREVFDKEHSC